jgi:hypothetical protein
MTPNSFLAGFNFILYITEGPVPELSTQTKKEIFKKIQIKEKSSTEEEIYEWAETYHALDNENAQGKKFYDWVKMHHEYLTDDVLRQVQDLNKKIQGTMAISLSWFARLNNPYNSMRIEADMKILENAKQRENDIDKDYESEITDFSKATTTTAPTITTTTTTTLKQGNKGRKKKWYHSDGANKSNSSSMNFFSIQSIMNNDYSSNGHHHSSHCGGSHNHSNCGGGSSSCGGGSSSCGGGS